MSVSFDRPVGAPADLSELEYVAALHQSQPGDLRPEASVKDVDIVHFLRSRYGIGVDVRTVRNSVLVGLGGGFDGGHGVNGKGKGKFDDDDLDRESGMGDGDGANEDDRGGEGKGGEKEDSEEEEDEDEDEVIDLAELVSVLLIPTLIQSAREELEGNDDEHRGDDDDPSSSLKRADFPGTDAEYASYRARRDLERSLRPPKGLISDVLSMIMADVGTDDGRRRKKATKEWVREVLVAYGEEEMTTDEGLLEEMVSALRGRDDDGDDDVDGTRLDAKAFARALTSDVRLYDATGNLLRETSNIDDVLAASSHAKEGYPASERTFENDGDALPEQSLTVTAAKPPEENKSGTAAPTKGNGSAAIESDDAKYVFSAGAIDFVADTYRSKLLVILLWTGFILSYWAYFGAIDRLIGQARANNQMAYGCYDVEPLDARIQCFQDGYDRIANTRGFINDALDCTQVTWELGCLIGRSFVRWLYILGLLMAIGLAYVGLGSTGNNVRSKRKWPIIFGIVSVGCLSYIFFFLVYRNEDFSYQYQYGFEGRNETSNTTETVWVAGDFTEERSPAYNSLVYYLTLIISTMAMILQFFILIGPFVKRHAKKDGSVASFFTPGSVVSEAKLKRAAARKLNGVVRNAREMHGEVAGEGEGGGASFGKALINFSLQGDKFETAGGFLWTWKRMFSGELFEVEGVWISSRIWAGNFAQFIIILVIITFGVVVTREAVEEWRKGLVSETNFIIEALRWLGVHLDSDAMAAAATQHFDELVTDLVTLNFGQGGNCTDTVSEAITDMGSGFYDFAPLQDAVNGAITGMGNISYGFAPMQDTINNATADMWNTTYDYLAPSQICLVLEHASAGEMLGVAELVKNITVSTKSAAKMVTDDIADSLYPQKEIMVKAPIIFATCIAGAAGVVLFVIYIPSVTSTILRFRSGAIPFLRDRKNAMDYRNQMDQILTVLGSMFFGALYSAVLLGCIFGGILFLFLWQATQDFMVQLFAMLVGLIITAVLKLLLVLFLLRATVFSGFYRKKPAQGNIVSLILESANIGFAVGTALARAIKLVLISSLYIGRMDTPLLAEGIGRGPLRDMYPTFFRKEILVHEAHRHPYMDVLGTMYLMKIRYGDRFGNRAGYTFRLIFVMALMPWIRKYRVMARPNLIDEDMGNNVNAENFDNSLLLPKSSILRSSVMSMSVKGKSTAEASASNLAPELEIQKLKNQITLRDAEIEEKEREIGAKDDEIMRLREALQKLSVVPVLGNDQSMEVRIT